MKVVCDSCQAKYQVPDERVAGRKLKIRCRRCEAAIIVRGDQILADEPTVSLPPAVPEEAWYLSHDDEEQGPMKLSELLGFLGDSGPRWDAFVWHEGMADWAPAREVTAVIAAHGGTPPAAATEDEQPTRMVDPTGLEGDATNVRSAEAFDGYVDRPSHPPLAGDRPSGAASTSQQRPVRASAAQPASAQPPTPSHPPLASDGPSEAMRGLPTFSRDPSVPPTPASSPHVGGADLVTGSRNEESVLFNVASLRQVASSSSPSLAPAVNDSRPPSVGQAGGDASGLIDIRALSDLSRQTAEREASLRKAPTVRTRSGDERVAHTPMVGLATPPLAPPPKRGGGLLLPVAILGGSCVLAAAVFLALWMRPQEVGQPVAAAAAPTAPAPTPSAAPAVEAPEAAAPEAEDIEPEAEDIELAADDADGADAIAEGDELAAADTGADEVAAAPAPVRKASARKRIARRKARKGGGASAKAAATKDDDVLAGITDSKPEKTKAPPPLDVDDILAGGDPSPTAKKAPEEAPKKAPTASGSRSIDDLLSGAVDSAPKKSSKPASPSRDQVMSAMSSVKGAVSQCGTRHQATGSKVKANIQVASNGRVKRVAVSGVSGPAAGCVEQAVKRAKFPEFSKPSFSISFPFKL